MKNPEMIIIGTENGVIDQDVDLLKKFYNDICEIKPRFEIGTWEEAESIKIFYNTFITAKLCLVNMIQDTAMKIGNMNVDSVTNALKNSTKRIMGPSYMKAGLGDGGGCHPRDNIALRWLSNKHNFGYDLFDAIVTSREIQSENIANFMIEKSNSDNFVILGTGFKPGTDQEEGSPSILVGHYLEKKRKSVFYTNSLANIEKGGGPYTYLIGHFGGFFNKYNFYKNSIVVDPWREFQIENRNDLIIYHYGNSRKQKK
jgi:UDPglucose 6-dehydrogenase